MQKLKTGTNGNVGALRADEIENAGARAERKASAQMLALAARRTLSERWLCPHLEPCTQRVGDRNFSVLEMLEHKAEGATAADASALTLGQAVRMLLSDTLVKISLHAYSKGTNGTRTSATEVLEGHVLSNPDYWDIGTGDKKAAEPAKPGPAAYDACTGWEHCIGHI
jgi:hypothetical protein